MTEESFAPLPNGMRLCYTDEGCGEPIVLVIGLGFQLIHWPRELIEALLAAGLRVITFDNRDSGRSSYTSGPGPSRWQLLTRQAPPGSYSLADMAQDTLGLLDRLGIRQAHLVGMSMGGMIAQVLSARHPQRVRSLTSVFSSTGARWVGQPGLRMTLQMARKPPTTREAFIRRMVQTLGRIGRGEYTAGPTVHRRLCEQAWERAGQAQLRGRARQLAAIFASGDRTAELAHVTAPTLVLHGSRDPLVHPSGGAATARAIPGARFVTIAGMAHEISPALAPRLARMIVHHVQETKAL